MVYISHTQKISCCQNHIRSARSYLNALLSVGFVSLFHEPISYNCALIAVCNCFSPGRVCHQTSNFLLQPGNHFARGGCSPLMTASIKQHQAPHLSNNLMEFFRFEKCCFLTQARLGRFSRRGFSVCLNVGLKEDGSELEL